MRDFLIVVIVLGSVPMILARPQIGILMWFWLGLMNPHRLTWGYAQQFRVALVVGVATLIGWTFSSESKRPPNSLIVWSLAALTFWVSLAALFAIHPEFAIPKWEEIIKILAMTFVTMCIVQSRERIQQLMWVIVVSLGAYGVKGGLFALATGGHYKVWGPEGSFIEDNNCLALALIMILPLIQHVRNTTENRWIRLGLLGMSGTTVVAILASWSRGALVGLCVTFLFFVMKSRHRVSLLLAGGAVFVLALFMLPQEWYARMNTIESYDTDQSALGRFDAWEFAFKLALDRPLTGGGQLVGSDDALFHHYVPTAPESRAAHSIYFEVLGETGFVGLGLFLFLLFASFRAASNTIRMTRNRPDLAWAQSLAAMVQVSFVGYAVTGAFLSLGFFDLYYALVAVIAVTQSVVRNELAKPASAAEGALQQSNLSPLEPAFPALADTSAALPRNFA